MADPTRSQVETEPPPSLLLHSTHDDSDTKPTKLDASPQESFDSVNFDPDSEKSKLVQMEDDSILRSVTKGQAISDEMTKRRWTGLVMQPIKWFDMMGRELDISFVFGIIATYGVSQGFGGALYKIAGGYYWKDVQKVQPAVSQIYHAIIGSVWDWKPVWGLLTDVVPVAGYRRRPYFILSGLLSFISLLVLVMHYKVHSAIAVILLLLYTLGVTIADVTIDAEIAKKSRDKPTLAPDIQTLCSISAAVGAFTGFSTSGFTVHHLGPKNALGTLSVSGVLFLLLGFSLHELRMSKHSLQRHKVGKQLLRTCRTMWTTISCPAVWKPTLFMYISWASSPSISEGKFYWYTDQERGLKFSQEFVGMSFAVGSIGAFFGTLLYQNFLRNCSFRKILFWAQFLVFVGGTIDLFLVLRWNLIVYMPDSMFFLFDEILINSVGRLKWIPQLVLCSKLCPAGIEGTFFALLMTVDNLGLLTASWGGAVLQHGLGITREDYSNLWLAALIRNILRLLPLALLFLVPNTDPSSQVIPNELLAIGREEGDEEGDMVELVGKALPSENASHC